jgi:ADP-ribose pyrophosphatase YjhB (NUDIX family)
VNAEEDPARAAERECWEETSLLVSVTGIIDIVFGREHTRGSDFVIFYKGLAHDGTAKAGDDAANVGWFDRNNLPDLAFKSTAYILSMK